MLCPDKLLPPTAPPPTTALTVLGPDGFAAGENVKKGCNGQFMDNTPASNDFVHPVEALHLALDLVLGVPPGPVGQRLEFGKPARERVRSRGNIPNRSVIS